MNQLLNNRLLIFKPNRTKLIPNRIRVFQKPNRNRTEIKIYTPHIPIN